ncbi:hypothetical protein D3C77_51920 [compost metagenome]
MSGVIEVEGFETGLACDALGHTQQDQVGNRQFLQHLAGHVQLAFTTVHQQYVRQLALTVLDPPEASSQGLVHGGIVVAGRDTFDVEAPVVGLQRPFGPKHHAGRHRRLTTGMADVVTLQTLRGFIQGQHLGQGFEPRCHMQAIGQACTQRLLGVGHRQLLPARAGTAHAVADRQLAPTQGFDGGTDGCEIFVHHVDDQLARQVALGIADVVLGKKRGHHFGHFFFDTDLREEILATQDPPAAHADQVHAGTAGVDERSDHINVAATAFHALLVLDPAQQGDLVAQLSGLLKLQGHRRLLHLGIELVGQLVTAAFEEHHRVTHIDGIFLRLDQADTRRLAALDLVLQARPGAVAVVAVFALADEKGFLQQAQAFTNGASAGVRPEVLALLLLRAAMNPQPRERSVREEHIRVGLIVAQQDVIRRPPFLDQRLLKQQRFGLVGGDGGLDLDDARHQGSRLRRQAGFAKIAGETLLEVFRLADIQQPGFTVEHPVDARATAAGRQEST